MRGQLDATLSYPLTVKFGDAVGSSSQYNYRTVGLGSLTIVRGINRSDRFHFDSITKDIFPRYQKQSLSSDCSQTDPESKLSGERALGDRGERARRRNGDVSERRDRFCRSYNLRKKLLRVPYFECPLRRYKSHWYHWFYD